jgi:hypothetical protein
MRIYKHYFNRDDTPYVQEYQEGKKYHTVWKRLKYRTFLKHRVVKIKMFGIFTIYDITKGGAE